MFTGFLVIIIVVDISSTTILTTTTTTGAVFTSIIIDAAAGFVVGSDILLVPGPLNSVMTLVRSPFKPGADTFPTTTFFFFFFNNYRKFNRKLVGKANTQEPH